MYGRTDGDYERYLFRSMIVDGYNPDMTHVYQQLPMGHLQWRCLRAGFNQYTKLLKGLTCVD